ncbi:hypothetical protein ABMD26_004388 [Pseudomonas sp. PvP001]
MPFAVRGREKTPSVDQTLRVMPFAADDRSYGCTLIV